MKKTSTFISALAVAVAFSLSAIPGESRADRWYDSKYFWGGSGLLVGGLVGYNWGHSDGSRYRDNYHSYSPVAYPYTVPGTPVGYIPGGPYLTGGTYFKETRVWPFYRRTESYPVAAMGPPQWRGQAVSMVDLEGPAGYSRANESGTPNEVSINLGDNNSNVVINVGGVPMTPETVTETVENFPATNSNAAGKENRSVDSRKPAAPVAPAQPTTKPVTETKPETEQKTEETATTGSASRI